MVSYVIKIIDHIEKVHDYVKKIKLPIIYVLNEQLNLYWILFWKQTKRLINFNNLVMGEEIKLNETNFSWNGFSHFRTFR